MYLLREGTGVLNRYVPVNSGAAVAEHLLYFLQDTYGYAPGRQKGGHSGPDCSYTFQWRSLCASAQPGRQGSS
jgi:hypothetical protein